MSGELLPLGGARRPRHAGCRPNGRGQGHLAKAAAPSRRAVWTQIRPPPAAIAASSPRARRLTPVTDKGEPDQAARNLGIVPVYEYLCPYDAVWGPRYAVVEDPDGNAVGIMSPIDPQRRSDPGFP